jgi:hypothetical protein
MRYGAIQIQPLEEAERRCPRCEEWLPVSEFGVCRARPDGLNLYCKPCIREKVAMGRAAVREYEQATGEHVKRENKTSLSARRIARMMLKLAPADRVRESIRHGAHTQKEIGHVARLSKDEVGDALANLLLWTREIRTQIVRQQRMYFINE